MVKSIDSKQVEDLSIEEANRQLDSSEGYALPEFTDWEWPNSR